MKLTAQREQAEEQLRRRCEELRVHKQKELQQVQEELAGLQQAFNQSLLQAESEKQQVSDEAPSRTFDYSFSSKDGTIYGGRQVRESSRSHNVQSVVSIEGRSISQSIQALCCVSLWPNVLQIKLSPWFVVPRLCPRRRQRGLPCRRS